jgi:hypothetical protein
MRIRLCVLIALLTCLVAAQAEIRLDSPPAPAAAGAVRIAYGSDPMQFSELRVPSMPGLHPLANVIDAKARCREQPLTAMRRSGPSLAPLTWHL